MDFILRKLVYTLKLPFENLHVLHVQSSEESTFHFNAGYFIRA